MYKSVTVFGSFLKKQPYCEKTFHMFVFWYLSYYRIKMNTRYQNPMLHMPFKIELNI